MEWVAILKLILDNAPAAITTVEAGVKWASETWSAIKDAHDKPADQITKEEIIAHIRHAQRSSDEIQKL